MYKNNQISWNIVFITQLPLPVHRETIKTTAAMGCEQVTFMDGGWITLMHGVNKPKRCIMTSYYGNDKSQKYENIKIKPTIYMIILIIVLTMIINSKSNNLDENTKNGY